MPSPVTDETASDPSGAARAGKIALGVDPDQARVLRRIARLAQPQQDVGRLDQRVRARSTPIASTSSSDSRSPAVSVSKIGIAGERQRNFDMVARRARDVR